MERGGGGGAGQGLKEQADRPTIVRQNLLILYIYMPRVSASLYVKLHVFWTTSP